MAEKKTAKVATATKKESIKKETVNTEVEVKEEAVATKKKAASVKSTYILQFEDKELIMSDLLDKAKSAYKELGETEGTMKTIKIYVKPEENAAYYVVNGVGSDNFRIEL